MGNWHARDGGRRPDVSVVESHSASGASELHARIQESWSPQPLPPEQLGCDPSRARYNLSITKRKTGSMATRLQWPGSQAPLFLAVAARWPSWANSCIVNATRLFRMLMSARMCLRFG